MSNTVSKSHFAKMCGVSRQGIGFACKHGSISLLDGKVNLDHRLTKQYLNKKKSEKPKKSKTVKPASKKKTSSSPPVVDTPVDEFGGPVIKSLDDINDDNIHLLTKADIDKFKVYEMAMTAKIKREEARGLLVTRSSVKLVFSKLYTVDNNEFKAMEERLTPSICGVFGSSDDSKESVAIRKMLNEEITKSLRHIKRIMNDYLVSIGAGKI